MLGLLEEDRQDGVIKWRDDYSVGVGIIDGQHRHFIKIADRLYRCITENNVKCYPEILKELQNYADFHFSTEERYFEEFKYGGAAEHKAEHDKLRARVSKFTHDEGELLIDGYKLLEFLEEWLVNHLEKMDKKFATFLNKNGLK